MTPKPCTRCAPILAFFDQQIGLAQRTLEAWASRTGHDRCHWHPEVLEQLCAIFGVQVGGPTAMPPRADFEAGCRRYADEQYGSPPALPVVEVTRGCPRHGTAELRGVLFDGPAVKVTFACGCAETVELTVAGEWVRRQLR